MSEILSLLLFVAPLVAYRINSVLNSFEKPIDDNEDIENQLNKRKILACTRIHKTQGMSSSYVAIEKVLSFLENLPANTDSVLICIGGVDDDNKGKDFLNNINKLKLRCSKKFSQGIHIIQIEPWGKFTHALNVAVRFAVDNNFDVLQFMSLETKVSYQTLKTLLSYLHSNVTVVGASLPGHRFNQGYNKIKGTTCPWNTLAIWDVNILGLTGFPLIGDGLPNVPGGVEEVTTINLLQKINPNYKAILISVPEVSWNIEFDDPKRKEWHETKMKSKNQRPQKHMELLGIDDGIVIHIKE